MNLSRRGFLQATGAGALAVALPTGVSARTTWDTMSDTWVATDGLGRVLPTHDEVGPPRADRFVGAFYFLWLGQHSTTGPWDISKILTANPDAINHTDDPAWGPLGDFHHWAEPHFGYYLSDDAWVIRKHAAMLADAGIDTVIFDVTNSFTYAEVYHVLLDTFAAVRAEGGTTPQVAFLCPFGDPSLVVKSLYDDLYGPGLHSDLWFRWKGKPLIMADPTLIGRATIVPTGPDPSPLTADHNQGQTFTATETFTAVGAVIPTWSTTDAAMTLTLKGDDGTPIKQQRFTNVVDNGAAMVELDGALPAGSYYLEQSEPSGQIGWWTDPESTYEGGEARVDGTAVPGDRSIVVQYQTDETVRDFFTFRKPQPSYFVGPTGPDQWGWLEVAPQHAFRDDSGAAEQMTVGVAQNAVDGRLGAMSEPAAYGRSYHDGTLPPDHSHTAEGLNLQEQWDRALAVDPEFVFVTGWNEWVAQRFTSFNGVDAPVVFVDQFDWEHSRDIEPVRGGADGGFPAGNDFQDAYYYQLVANVRRFKGARPMPTASAPKTIRIDGNFDSWRDVGPEFRDHIGDTMHRSHPGWGGAVRYVNRTGRNDIVATKVARDSDNVYFYVRTRGALTPHTGKHWMMLFLDVTGDPATSWEGFDFVINRTVRDARRTVVEASTGGWNWQPVAEVSYAARGRELELAVPKSVLGLDATVRVAFKWIDNLQRAGDILDVIGNGDTAPSGRFRYRYAG